MNTQKYLPTSKVIGLLPPMAMTHEEFIAAVRDVAISRLTTEPIKDRVRFTKIGYGSVDGVRGVCHFGTWQNGTTHDLVTISTIGEESPLQLCGTVLHELGHVVAGASAGHGKAWKEACRELGLTVAEAAGQAYDLPHFSADVQTAIMSLTYPTDGRPTFGNYMGALPVAKTFRPCPLGIGTRGGKSRGQGSGSRLRKWVCSCGQIVRASTDDLNAYCGKCGGSFNRDYGMAGSREPVIPIPGDSGGSHAYN